MKNIIILFFILISTLYGNWKAPREALDKIYIKDKFRFFYTLKGKNRIKNKADINNNNIPDFIENLAIELTTAQKLLTNKLHFIHPLENKVYKNRAKYIDIHILSLKKNLHGLAGDAVINYNYKILKKSDPSITMVISNKLNLGNHTPLHELFHIYQNGYSMIKNNWYSEGTARWSEYIFSKRKPKTKPLPKNKKELQTLLKQSYKASLFWNRLASICHKEEKKSSFIKVNYIGTKRKFIINKNPIGHKFMNSFLSNLSKMDKIIEEKKSLKKHKWKEKQQRANYNNKYLLRALSKTLSKCHKNEELHNFLNLLKVEKLNF